MPTCLVILLKHLHTVSLLLSNNKGLHNLHPLIELFFPFFFWSPHFISALVTRVKCCPPPPPTPPSCSLIVFLSETVEECAQRLTINLIAAASVQLRAPGLWYGTPSEFPFSLPVSTSMSLSKSARWSDVSPSFLVTDVSQSAADLGDTCHAAVHVHGLAAIGI